MPEEKPAGIKSTVSGWIKAAVTSVVGLLSGAVIMYLTPFVNNAIKPSKPVANFASQTAGLTVNFNNRSTGAVQGWWDFGDGAALEPFDPKLDLVQHTYAKPGTYNVKLALQNLLGEASDRTAPVTLDANTDSAAPKPEIVSFDLIPLTRDERVPAVYRLLGKVKTATHCILSAGDDRPMEILDDVANLERYITFNDMGSYTVRLAAVNGKQLVEKTQTVFVSPNDSNNPTAKLLVTYEAVRVERFTRDLRVNCGWQADVKDGVSSPFRKERPADSGCTIVSAELVNKNDRSTQVRNVSVTTASDKTKFIVAGELVRTTGVLAPKAAPPSWLAEVKVVMERRSRPQTINRGDVVMTVGLNSTTKIPMQPLEEGWEVVRKKVSLELWDGSRKVWEGNQAVTGAKMTLKNQTCLVTVIPQSDGFALKLDPAGLPTSLPPLSVVPLLPPLSVAPLPPETPPAVGPIRKTGYEFNPLFPKKTK